MRQTLVIPGPSLLRASMFSPSPFCPMLPFSPSLPFCLYICRIDLCALEPTTAKDDQAPSGLTNADVVRQLQWQMDMDALDSVIRDSDIKNR